LRIKTRVRPFFITRCRNLSAEGLGIRQNLSSLTKEGEFERGLLPHHQENEIPLSSPGEGDTGGEVVTTEKMVKRRMFEGASAPS
jgi:hypothetical protein